MIRAIETEYKGYLFRSRIEARWAVFFDALGLKWDYEKEGVCLPSNKAYLPDFHLPGIGYIEIKGAAPTKGEKDLCSQLATCSNEMVFITCGSINDQDPINPLGNYESMYAFFPSGAVDYAYWFCECLQCGSVGIQFNGRADRLDCRLSGKCNKSTHGDKGYSYDTPRLITAYTAAKKARFEYGAHGSPYPYMATRRGNEY